MQANEEEPGDELAQAEEVASLPEGNALSLELPSDPITDRIDDPLVMRVRSGDREALGELITTRRAPLLAYIERQLGTALRRKVEPEDLLQELSADAIRSLPEVDLGQRDPFGWLCQIAQRRIIDAHRRYFSSQKRAAGREVSIDAPVGDASRGGLIDLLCASMTSASAAFSRDQKQMRILHALEQLPAEHRDALRMRYLEGLPSKEIAAKLGKTDGAVRVILTRTLSKLQQLLVEESN